MSTKLHRQYVELALKEAHDARVPNQMVNTKEAGQTDGDENEAAEVSEFSGVGGIMGYTAPLGMDPDKLGRKKNAPKKK